MRDILNSSVRTTGCPQPGSFSARYPTFSVLTRTVRLFCPRCVCPHPAGATMPASLTAFAMRRHPTPTYSASSARAVSPPRQLTPLEPPRRVRIFPTKLSPSRHGLSIAHEPSAAARSIRPVSRFTLTMLAGAAFRQSLRQGSLQPTCFWLVPLRSRKWVSALRVTDRLFAPASGSSEIGMRSMESSAFARKGSHHRDESQFHGDGLRRRRVADEDRR